MRQYLDVLSKVMTEGTDRSDTEEVSTRSTTAQFMRFNMQDGFPAVTTKRLAFRTAVAELLWFISGSSNVNELHKLGVKIWDGDAYKPSWLPKAQFPGDVGRNYSKQWREWLAPDGRHVDQLGIAINLIQEKPWTARALVSAWNPGELEATALPACHVLFQFYSAGGKLSLTMYQRSCDMFLGVPFDTAEFALLLHLVAQITNLEPWELIHVLAEPHIYEGHFEAVKEQLTREPFPHPKLWLNPELRTLDQVVAKYRELLQRAEGEEKPLKLMDEVARLEGYKSHEPLKAEMVVIK